MADNKHYEDFYSKTDWKQYNLLIAFGTKAYLNIFEGLTGKHYQKICDVGCGTGKFTNVISKLGYTVKGFDFSNAAIQKAKKAYPNLDFTCQDATDLKYTEKFDAFFVNGFSLFNTLDLNSAKSLIRYWTQFLNKEGAIFILSKTDFSARIHNGWHYHTKAQVNEMFNLEGLSTQVYYIHSSLKYLCLLPFAKIWLKVASILSGLIFNKILKLPLRSLIIITKND